MHSKKKPHAPYDNGLIIGKFVVFHYGHCFLIETALRLCNTLHVCVCSRQSEVLSGTARREWIEKTYSYEIASGALIVHHITKEIHEAHADNPKAPAIWAEEIQKIIPVQFDAVFASEQYGWKFAKCLGASFVPIDIHRDTVPVSSQVIQQKPHAYWKYLPATVRASLVFIIGLRGDTALMQRFVKKLQASVYIPYSVRENTIKISHEHSKDVTMAELAALSHRSAPLMCVMLPYKNYKKCDEYHVCEEIFTIQSEAHYDDVLFKVKKALTNRIATVQL